MAVERTPTPLPDFNVDEELLIELRRRFAEHTARLLWSNWSSFVQRA
jgi:hypothetical protein